MIMFAIATLTDDYSACVSMILRNISPFCNKHPVAIEPDLLMLGDKRADPI